MTGQNGESQLANSPSVIMPDHGIPGAVWSSPRSGAVGCHTSPVARLARYGRKAGASTRVVSGVWGCPKSQLLVRQGAPGAAPVTRLANQLGLKFAYEMPPDTSEFVASLDPTREIPIVPEPYGGIVLSCRCCV